MRQMGWRVEELEVILRSGSAWWSVIETKEGTRLPAGDDLELHFGAGLILAPEQRVDTDTQTEFWFRRTKPQIIELLTLIAATKNRDVSLWYVSAAGNPYEFWAGKVVIDR